MKRMYRRRRRGRLRALLHGGDDRPPRLGAAHHPHADAGREDRIDEGRGVAGQEVAGAGVRGAAVAEIGQHVGLGGEGGAGGALAQHRAAGDPPGEHLVGGEPDLRATWSCMTMPMLVRVSSRGMIQNHPSSQTTITMYPPSSPGPAPDVLEVPEVGDLLQVGEDAAGPQVLAEQGRLAAGVDQEAGREVSPRRWPPRRAHPPGAGSCARRSPR